MRHEIVPLRHEHLMQWYGDDGRAPTVKGIAAFVDGELAAIAGFRITQGVVIAFCDLKESARPFRHAIHRTALKLMDEAKARHRRIVAVCDEREPTAPKWLRRLGFEPEDNGIWAWHRGAVNG
ncbi:MAG: hypothetical protein AB7O39_03150 [Flavobacteriaceae bacterium]